jgi:Flp pilus assembly protein TadG
MMVTVLKWFRTERGNISPLMALMLVPIVGAMAMGTEASNWFFTARAAQHAADSAVLAAGTRDILGDSNYIDEGLAVAKSYGFTVATNNTLSTTNALVNIEKGVTCPNNTSDTNCYRATVQRRVPVYLTPLIGFSGDVGSLKLIQAVAIAETKTILAPDCLISKSNSTAKNNYAIRTNGGNSIDMHGCSVATAGQIACNGNAWNADSVSYASAKNGDLCGNVNIPNATTVPDPYDALKTNVPSKTACSGSYPQAPSKKNDPALPTANVWTASPTWDGTSKVMCGDQQLGADVTLSGAATTLTIYNGGLDLNGHTLSTASGAGVTVIFAGDSSASGFASTSHIISGSGTLDIAAPTGSGATWKGVLLYQDPTTLPSGTNNIDFSAFGNSPTLAVTGVVYLPNANVTVAGSINHKLNGNACFTLVDWTTLLSGTGALFQDSLGSVYNSQGQCSQAGVTQTFTNLNRVTLVR